MKQYEAVVNTTNPVLINQHQTLIIEILKAYTERTVTWSTRLDTLNWYVLNLCTVLMGEQPATGADRRVMTDITNGERYRTGKGTTLARFLKQAFPQDHRIWTIVTPV